MAKVGFGAMNWILGGLVFVTLYFQTTLTDPFNSPKLWILLITAAWLFGYLFGYRKIILLSPPITQFTIFLFVFLVFLILVTAMTDQKYVAFFGETQRRNGFFQYTSLLIISLASAMFIRTFNVKRLFLVIFYFISI
jgi:purine-cytosine permease-like protein